MLVIVIVEPFLDRLLPTQVFHMKTQSTFWSRQGRMVRGWGQADDCEKMRVSERANEERASEYLLSIDAESIYADSLSLFGVRAARPAGQPTDRPTG